MTLQAAKAAKPTIASGSTRSDVVPAENIRHADYIEIHTPDTLSGTVTVQVRPPGGSDWDDYEADQGSAITVPAGAVKRFPAPGNFDLSLNSGSPEAAARDFEVYALDSLR